MDETPDVSTCTRCEALVDSRSQIVNGSGAADADLLFVGEGPGEQEDAEGEPFVGRSGDVLGEVLGDHRVDRDRIRITNCVRCRPPDNRDPSASELANCEPHLQTEVRLVDPKLVVALGKVPAEHILGRDVRVTHEAGTVEAVELGGRPREVLISPHPAATLYDPSQQSAFENAVGAALERVETGGDQSSLEEF